MTTDPAKNRKRRLSTLMVSIMLALSGCGGGASEDNNLLQPTAAAAATNFEGKPTPASCEVADLNSWVHRSMLDYYLFYDQVDRNIDSPSYASPEELITDLRVSPNDRFSYVTDESTYEAFFDEGEAFGYGWNFARSESGTLVFSLIDPNSPLAEAGISRGEELIAINAIEMDDFVELSAEAQGDIIGSGNEAVTLSLTIGGTDNISRVVNVTKSTYSLQTVLDASVMDTMGVMTGYLNFYQFLDTSSQELRQAFETFETAGISELVLDLRFNGGGRIAIANELASYIIGPNHSGNVFTHFAFNDRYSDQNQSLNFFSMDNSLELDRVFVLQSNNTCSASELVINGLRPFVDVITVGSRTCGKPYATSPSIACGKVSNVLEIELLNAAGVGGYYDGISADCPATEDLSVALGSTAEPLLAAALSYIETGTCAPAPRHRRSEAYRLSSQFRPGWQGGSTRW